MYIYMYTYISLSLSLYIYIYTYICIHIYVYIHTSSFSFSREWKKRKNGKRERCYQIPQHIEYIDKYICVCTYIFVTCIYKRTHIRYLYWPGVLGHSVINKHLSHHRAKRDDKLTKLNKNKNNMIEDDDLPVDLDAAPPRFAAQWCMSCMCMSYNAGRGWELEDGGELQERWGGERGAKT